MSQLLKFLFRKQKRLHMRHLMNPYQPDSMSWDEHMIVMAGKSRSPERVRSMMKHYQVDDAGALLKLLPKRRRPTLWSRVLTLLQRAEGSMAYDPIKIETRTYRKMNSPSSGSVTITRLAKDVRTWGD